MERLPFAPARELSDRLNDAHCHPVTARVDYGSFPFTHGLKLGEMKLRRRINQRMSHEHASKDGASGAGATKDEDCGFAHRVVSEGYHGFADSWFVTECHPHCEVARQRSWRRTDIQLVGVKCGQAGKFPDPREKRISQREATYPLGLHLAEQSVGSDRRFRGLHPAPTKNSCEKVAVFRRWRPKCFHNIFLTSRLLPPLKKQPYNG